MEEVEEFIGGCGDGGGRRSAVVRGERDGGFD